MDNNFDIFITVEKNLPYQQNLEMLAFSLIIIEVINNILETIRATVPAIIELIDSGNLGKLHRISPG